MGITGYQSKFEVETGRLVMAEHTSDFTMAFERLVSDFPAFRTPTDDLVNDEHARFNFYARLVDGAELPDDFVHVILKDPDRIMAESTLLRYVDHTAELLKTPAAFEAWAASVNGEFAGSVGIVRRVEEQLIRLRLLSGIQDDLNGLLESSDWLQRRMVEESVLPSVMEALAGGGRTKRVRNMAKEKIRKF